MIYVYNLIINLSFIIANHNYLLQGRSGRRELPNTFRDTQ